MGRDGLNRNLEKLHRNHTSGGNHRDDLEKDLLLRYRKIHPQKKRFLTMLNPTTRIARYALVGLAVLLLGVGACSTETTTEVELGRQVSINLAGQLNVPDGQGGMNKTIDINQRVQQVMNQFSTADGIEEVNVNIEQNGEGDLALSLSLYGEDLDDATLTAMLRESFPEIPDEGILIEVIEGSYTESWAQRLGREVFHIESGGGTDEEIRARVLEQIAEQGFDGEVDVEVSTDDGQQTLKIMMTEDEDVDE